MNRSIEYATKINDYYNLKSTVDKGDKERVMDIAVIIDGLIKGVHESKETSDRARAIAAIKREFPKL